MKLLPIKVVDARGEIRTLVSVREAIRAGADQDALHDAGAFLVRWRIWIWMWALMFLAGFLPPFVISGFVNRPPFSDVVSSVAMSLTAIGLLTAPFAVLARRRVWGHPPLVRDGLLAQGLCPACGHGVRGIPPGPDGCTVCPECGAAWRARGETPTV